MQMGVRTRLSLLATVSTAIGAGAWVAPAHAAAVGPVVTFALQGADASGDLVMQEAYEPYSQAGPFLWAGTFSVSTTGTLTSVTTDCGDGTGPQAVAVSGAPMMGASGTMHCAIRIGTTTLTVSATDTTGAIAVSHQVIIKAPVVPPLPPVVRFDGSTRYGTGVALSQAAFPSAGSAGAVVLARGDVFADALAGIPLTKAKNGPLLLTPGGVGVTGLDPHVESELVRVLPRDKSHTVYILGGVGAIPQSVEDYISSTLGYTTVRLSGASRYDTALAIASDPRALNGPQNTVVARGDDFADALAAGPFASNPYKDAQGVPAAIVLTDGTGAAAHVPAATAAYLQQKMAAGAKVLAIGGGAATAVGTLPGSAGRFDQIVGQDRYDTAGQVADRGWPDGPEQPFTQIPLGIAVGTAFPDSLTGGAYMAQKNGPLMLAYAHPNMADYLSFPLRNMFVVAAQGRRFTEVDAFGGPKVITPDHVYELLSLLHEDIASYVEHRVAF